jgi:hypothetical protein
MAQHIDGSRNRLKFVREELAYQSTDESALKHLRCARGHMLPKAAAANDDED